LHWFQATLNCNDSLIYSNLPSPNYYTFKKLSDGSFFRESNKKVYRFVPGNGNYRSYIFGIPHRYDTVFVAFDFAVALGDTLMCRPEGANRLLVPYTVRQIATVTTQDGIARREYQIGGVGQDSMSGEVWLEGVGCSSIGGFEWGERQLQMIGDNGYIINDNPAPLHDIPMCNQNPTCSAVAQISAVQTSGNIYNITNTSTGVYGYSAWDDKNQTTAQPFTLNLDLGHYNSIPGFPPVYVPPSDSQKVCLHIWNQAANCFADTCITLHRNVATSNRADNLSYKLFPNPATNEVTIQYSNFQNKQLIITDVLGRPQKVVSLHGEETRANIQNFSNGIYYVGIYENGRLLASCTLVVLRE
jgi:hypothetical protein